MTRQQRKAAIVLLHFGVSEIYQFFSGKLELPCPLKVPSFRHRYMCNYCSFISVITEYRSFLQKFTSAHDTLQRLRTNCSQKRLFTSFCEEQVRLESFLLRTWLVFLCLKERLKLAKAIVEISAQRFTIGVFLWLR